jgi:transcriptional regulator with XRE-family HTH domain
MAITETTPLRRAREARGLKLADVASASGVCVRTVSNAELGRHQPHRSSKKLLALALEADPGDLWPSDEADTDGPAAA